MGAAFLCAEFGFDGDVRSAGYIGTWIELLKADKRAFFTACSQASKAANYLRGLALAEPGQPESAPQMAASARRGQDVHNLSLCARTRCRASSPSKEDISDFQFQTMHAPRAALRHQPADRCRLRGVLFGLHARNVRQRRRWLVLVVSTARLFARRSSDWPIRYELCRVSARLGD